MMVFEIFRFCQNLRLRRPFESDYPIKTLLQQINFESNTLLGEGLGAQPLEADISNSEDRDLTNRVNISNSVPFQRARFKARAKLKTKPT